MSKMFASREYFCMYFQVHLNHLFNHNWRTCKIITMIYFFLFRAMYSNKFIDWKNQIVHKYDWSRSRFRYNDTMVYNVQCTMYIAPGNSTENNLFSIIYVFPTDCHKNFQHEWKTMIQWNLRFISVSVSVSVSLFQYIDLTSNPFMNGIFGMRAR